MLSNFLNVRFEISCHSGQLERKSIVGRKMAATSRRSEIADVIAAAGFMRIDDLAERFQVTPMTIHRDLDELDARGAVTKVRSGARAMPIEEIERNVTLRRHHMLPQKQAIAGAAIAWLDAQATSTVVALDDSTTALATASGLAERRDLTVVTNFQPAIEIIAAAQAASLFTPGGTYAPEFQSFVGSSTHESISSIQIDVLFMSVASVGPTAVFNPSEAPLLVKRAFLKQAQQSVLLVDHTKFARRALHRQASLEEFVAVIVDDGIDPDDEQRLRDNVETVIVVPVTTEEEL